MHTDLPNTTSIKPAGDQVKDLERQFRDASHSRMARIIGVSPRGNWTSLVGCLLFRGVLPHKALYRGHTLETTYNIPSAFYTKNDTYPMKCRVVTMWFNNLGSPLRNILNRSVVDVMLAG